MSGNTTGDSGLFTWTLAEADPAGTTIDGSWRRRRPRLENNIAPEGAMRIALPWQAPASTHSYRLAGLNGGRRIIVRRIDEDRVKEVKPSQQPVNGTAAARAYFKAVNASIRFMGFIIEVTLRGDYTAYVLKHALEQSDEARLEDPAELARQRPGRLIKFLRSHRQMLLEMFLVRLVDSFQSYIVDLVRDVLRKEPRVLKSRQQTIDLDTILEHTTMPDLLDSIIEGKVNDLSHKGFTSLQSWCAERGIPIQTSGDQLLRLVELIATRNVIAHNRGTIDSKYLTVVQDPRFSVGQVRIIGIDELFEASEILNAVVTATDLSVAAKFALQCGPFQDPDASQTAEEGPPSSSPPQSTQQPAEADKAGSG